MESIITPILGFLGLEWPQYLMIFALIGIFIVALSGRPVVFRQTRAGRDGRPFTLLKFRTMREEGGDEIHRRYATADVKLINVTDPPSIREAIRALRSRVGS